METLESGGEIRLLKFRLGPYDNNAYVVVEVTSGTALVIDAPPDGERMIEELGGLKIERILITHGHFDHVASLRSLREATGARVAAHPAETSIPADEVDEQLSDGQVIPIGKLRLEVIETPGHTPGSVCFLIRDHLFSGDTLFPGGPGRSGSPQDLRREISSIVDRLHPLPSETAVHPGHGDGTTIGLARDEYAVFAAGQHPPDLCGDVLWATS